MIGRKATRGEPRKSGKPKEHQEGEEATFWIFCTSTLCEYFFMSWITGAGKHHGWANVFRPRALVAHPAPDYDSDYYDSYNLKAFARRLLVIR